MKWSIITDSSCDLVPVKIVENNTEIDITSVPFIVSVGEKDYIDDGNVNIDELIEDMGDANKIAHTSCPAPGTWIDKTDSDSNLIMITISKELSGSFNSACVAKDTMLENNPDRNIAVINSLSAGPGLATILQRVCEEIIAGTAFDKIVNIANEVAQKQQTLFALCSFNNLVKNGRMNKLVGFIAGKLNFWGIGIATDIGTIDVKEKVRGYKSALKILTDIISKDLSTIKTIHISHCKNFEMANEIKNIAETICQEVRVEINETKALCSFYAEKQGIIISYI